MLLMVEKGTRGGICYSIHGHGKANNKYMKTKNYHILCSQMEIIYMDG